MSRRSFRLGHGRFRRRYRAPIPGPPGSPVRTRPSAACSGAPGADRSRTAEEGPVGEDDRHRDVALKAVFSGCVMAAISGVLGDIVDDDGFVALRISWQMVVSSSSSPPGTRPNSISSRTAQQTQRCSVTRATAAKAMPVERHTTSRIRGTAAIPLHGGNIRAGVGSHHEPLNVSREKR